MFGSIVGAAFNEGHQGSFGKGYEETAARESRLDRSSRAARRNLADS
jgi:hypothetical protein